jgi:predicted membrane protein
MIQTFKLKKGEILFDNDKIIINDNAKKQRFFILWLSCCGSIFGIGFAFNSLQSNEQIRLWLGLLIGLLNISGLILWLLRSAQSEISLSDVKSIKLSQKFSNKFLDIRLNNNRLRRVIRVDNKTELEEFIETNFGTDRITVANIFKFRNKHNCLFNKS